MKHKFPLLIAIFFLSASLYADYKIAWIWKVSDPKVTWVRYRVIRDGIDDENSVKWEYVNKYNDSTMSFVLDVDRDKIYTLEVQDSYDGVWWSKPHTSKVDTSIYTMLNK